MTDEVFGAVFCSYVYKRISKPIAVAELQKLVGFSKGHFSRAFKQSFGMSPRAYIQSAKLMFAMRMITGTDRALGAVAVEAGYCDQSHMSNVFRKMLGVSPGELRRALGTSGGGLEAPEQWASHSKIDRELAASRTSPLSVPASTGMSFGSPAFPDAVSVPRIVG